MSVSHSVRLVSCSLNYFFPLRSVIEVIVDPDAGSLTPDEDESTISLGEQSAPELREAGPGELWLVHDGKQLLLPTKRINDWDLEKQPDGWVLYSVTQKTRPRFVANVMQSSGAIDEVLPLESDPISKNNSADARKLIPEGKPPDKKKRKKEVTKAAATAVAQPAQAQPLHNVPAPTAVVAQPQPAKAPLPATIHDIINSPATRRLQQLSRLASSTHVEPPDDDDEEEAAKSDECCESDDQESAESEGESQRTSTIDQIRDQVEESPNFDDSNSETPHT